MTWPSPWRPRSQTVALSLVPALDEAGGVDVVLLDPRLELQPAHVGQPAGQVGDLPHRRGEHHPGEAAEVAAVGGLHVDRARLLERADHERDRAAVEERRDDRAPGPAPPASCSATGPSSLYSGR